jgi:hypothetical protein
MLYDSYTDDKGLTHLELKGVVHEVHLSQQQPNNYGEYLVFVSTLAAPNGFNLDQADVNALYKFLKPLVTEE